MVLGGLVERLWELDTVPENKELVKFSPEQIACEDHFVKNVANSNCGRFLVRLPFKSDPHVLGSSFDVAKRRFVSLSVEA